MREVNPLLRGITTHLFSSLMLIFLYDVHSVQDLLYIQKLSVLTALISEATLSMHIVRVAALGALCTLIPHTCLFLLLISLNRGLLESYLCLVKSRTRQATINAGLSQINRVHVATHDLTHSQIHPRIHIESLLVQDDSTPFGLLKTGDII